ncbi:Fe-S cluster assembly protein SufD [Segetibacter sp. 3557_3]|uniref:Fe-S cluster assembly protein SufD n=1 Tax=Segetibacter sp. 3557_3 TaxID=2547429 RepID=UPI001058872B|nr:Fe-S cluster assembly protein SufD [Segetibacter sp. 3557_3]TDH27751.1 Fe-S cluster assembly protein SufD [Segetibacter sp. 3557_3]
MTKQITIPLYTELLEGFSHSDENATDDTLQKIRRAGFENFKKSGFPTRRDEDWKYTTISSFLQEQYHINGIAKELTASAELISEAIVPSLDAYQLVLVNGKLQPHNNNFPGFIKIIPISEAVIQDDVRQHFAGNSTVASGHFAALNTALFSNGLFIEISANAAIDKPLHIVHAFTSATNVFIQPRHLFVVHQGAELNVIETIVSENSLAKIFVNSLTEVIVEENASFNHYVLQTAKTGVRLVNQTDVKQKRHSVYSNYTFCMPKADLIRNNLNVALNAEQTETHLYGLYLGEDQQLIDNHSLIHHKFPHCNSNEIYKGVLLDKATGVFNGKVFVNPEAQKTNAFQQNNNLLLSNNATINTKPQLEIFADDVKCSHGATVGQLSKEAMFYLQSRGIGEEAARALLVNAFAFDVTEKIKIPELEQYINHLIALHIPGNKN